MKQKIILTIISVFLLTTVAVYQFFTMPREDGNSFDAGKKMMEMERETDKTVTDIKTEIINGNITDEDCSKMIDAVVTGMLSQMEQLDQTDARYINIMYNCNIIRKLSGMLEDKKLFTKNEKILRNHELAAFSNSLFIYCLAVDDGTNEKKDYNELQKEGRKIEEDRENLVKTFVAALFEELL